MTTPSETPGIPPSEAFRRISMGANLRRGVIQQSVNQQWKSVSLSLQAYQSTTMHQRGTLVSIPAQSPDNLVSGNTKPKNRTSSLQATKPQRKISSSAP